MTATVEEKLACLRRELALRRNVYPKWVASGRMKQGAADRELRVMAAIIEDYREADETEGQTALREI